MWARSVIRVLIPGVSAAGLGLIFHGVWAEPIVSLLASATGAVGGALLMQRPEDYLSPARTARPAVPPMPETSRTTLPAGAGQMLLEHLPMGVMLIDAFGHVLLINATAVQIIGRRPPGEFHASALRAPKLLDAIETSLAGGVSSSVDFTLSRGSDMHLRAHVRPVSSRMLTPDGARRAAVMVVIEDVTQTRRAEELHRDFVANASHELKTPLSSISGVIETLQGHARDDPEASARFFEMMRRQTERMKQLVDDLLSLNRIELNERVQPTEAQRLCEIVGEVGETMRPIARAAGHTLEVTMPDPELEVRGSFEELGQVFRNLIDNAIKYGRQGGRVALDVLADDPSRPGMIGLVVADDGPGIAREHLPRLTERFYRVSVKRSRARGGTGLGLAIVKHVVTRHRGQLEIESRLGEGSRFAVWLPLVQPPAQGVPAMMLQPRGAARPEPRAEPARLAPTADPGA